MEAVFFLSRPEEAVSIGSVDDLLEGPAAKPIAIDSPGAVSGLVSALDEPLRGGLRPLRAATCQSFPVWLFSRKLAEVLASLDDERVDAVARRWHAGVGDALRGADLFELSSCLGELRDALRHCEPEDRLCVLLEEKAF